MRILVLSAMFPPNVLGGAEICAYNLAKWMQKQGHEVGVLTAAKSPDEVKSGEMVDGMKVWSLDMPRPYPVYKQGRGVSPYLKPLWHLQDHLDPRNPAMVAKVLDAFKPDFCQAHYVTGIGHNVLAEFGKRDIPLIYYMHDLGLSCLKMTMFANGKTCEAQCGLCKVSAARKRADFTRVPRIGFCSPSRANLDRNAEFQPLKDYPNVAILNANPYVKPTQERMASDTIRFVYTGRLEVAKGVGLLLEAAEQVAERWPFTLKVVGSGKDEEALRARFGHHPWVTFMGHVPQQEAVNAIAGGDVLCVPSVWFENSPGVVIEALRNGTPVIGSEVGGIPELVQPGFNGLLVPPGDSKAWRETLERVLSDPSRLDTYRANAASRAHEFEQDYIGAKHLAFMETVRNFKPRGALEASTREAASR
ncbi:glycosyltransferase [Xanthobacter autotrophicus]|uniref:glycosyltransferase n=1 Tax=Xanthobacter autotrophicus TaxID=280 RepID=UPI00372CC4A1